MMVERPARGTLRLFYRRILFISIELGFHFASLPPRLFLLPPLSQSQAPRLPRERSSAAHDLSNLISPALTRAAEAIRSR